MYNSRCLDVVNKSIFAPQEQIFIIFNLILWIYGA